MSRPELMIKRVGNGWRLVEYGRGGAVGCTNELVFTDDPNGVIELMTAFHDWLKQTTENPELRTGG